MADGNVGSNDLCGWTASAAIVARTIGLQAAVTLIREYGGTKIYFPNKFMANSKVSKLIGEEATRKLYMQFGCELELPNNAFLRTRKGRIIELATDGKATQAQIAREVGCTTRYVRMVLRDISA